MESRPSAIEDFACVLILIFFGVAGAIPGIAPNQANEMTGAPASGLMFAAGIGSQLLINALIVLLVLRQAPALFPRLRMLHFAGLLAAFAMLSALWSQDPLLTERRAIPFTLAALFAASFALSRPLARQLVLLERAFLLMAIGSVVLALGFPALGLDASTGHAGDWQGVFTQKNACGRAMVFATAAVLAQGRLNARRAVSLVVFLALLALSGSRGAWLIEGLLLAVVGAHALLARWRPGERTVLAAASAAAAAMAAAFAVAGLPRLAPLLGRDPTLTGRTTIWAQVWIAILKHPWLGYGFSAFWRGTRSPSFDVVVALRFVLFHAHNGFLEIWLELGAAGLLLFALSYARGWRRLLPSLWYAERSNDPSAGSAALWPLCVLVLIAAYDLDENTLLSFNGLFWILYIHALVTLERAPAPARGRVRIPIAAPPTFWPAVEQAAPALALALPSQQALLPLASELRAALQLPHTQERSWF